MQAFKSVLVTAPEGFNISDKATINDMANNPNASANLKPFKKGESGNPSGRTKKLTTTIGAIPKDAQEKIYAVLYKALETQDKFEAAAVLQRGAQELPQYGMIYQLAMKELLGKNGWSALNDILDRLFGKAKIVTENAIKSSNEENAIIIVKSNREQDEH